MMIPRLGCKPSRGIFYSYDQQADGFGFHPPIVLFWRDLWYLKVQKVSSREKNGRMEAESIRPLIISAKDTTACFAIKPWYHHSIYASVSALSRDARIHCIRHLGLLRSQQAKKPYVMYASVSARSRDARILHKSSLHRGSARPCRALIYNIGYLGLMQAQQPKLP